MIVTTTFDPADYIENEEAAKAYLDEADATGNAEFIEDAKQVVERARKRWS
jgi:DNA-binding phage protein